MITSNICVSSNIIFSHQVSILYPASIISVTDLTTSPINPGSPVEIRCKVDGNPVDNSAVTWEKVGSKTDFANETSFSADESILYIPRATASMSGEYICIANNSIPKSSPKTEKKGTFVRVKHKPILDMKVTMTKKACDKEKVVVPKCVLMCQASGTPDVTFTWLRRGSTIQEGDKYGLEANTVEVMAVRAELEIKTVWSDDYDNYTCIASNGLGDVRHHVALSVTGKPDAPVHFAAVDATHDTIVLRWSLDFTGGYKLEDIGYKLRQKKAGSESYVYRDIPKVEDNP